MFQFFINAIVSVRWLNLFALLLLSFICLPCKAQPLKLDGKWYEAPSYSYCAGPTILQCPGMMQIDQINKTGGHVFWQGNFEIGQTTRLVVDFKNSSVIGMFHHRIFDDHDRLVAESEGGIQSVIPNPFFLRHGREFTLLPGHYRLTTEISSPFFLAQPTPYLDTLVHYQQAIKLGDALTLLSMGVLLGLIFYYAVLAGIRRNATDGFYALFILGNLLYNGTALLVFTDLFGLHWFYLISFPILFSNGIYVLFVLRLLDITSVASPRLYRLGMVLLGLFVAFALLSLFKPNWSLELDRTGVALFLCYGLLSGIVRNRQGHFLASRYLAAVVVFFVLGILAISLGRLAGLQTIYVEHLGLLAVTVEVLLLALVLARQFSQLRMQFERAYVHATQDALTGLQNRRGFVEAGNSEVERSKRYGHSLSVIYLDLDNFKQLNDTRGHDIGDAALRAIARALRSVLRSNDLLARLGGDEFAMMLPEIGREAASEVGRKIFIAVNDALQEFPPVTASIGVIGFTKVTWTFSGIMKEADELMYEVKNTGKNDVHFRHYG